MDEETKVWWKSKRVLGLAVLGLSVAFPKLGPQIPDIVTTAGDVIGGIITVWGFIHANKTGVKVTLKSQKTEL